LFRLGTCGSVNPDVEVDNMLVSENVVGLDGLLHFYIDYDFENEFSKNFLEKFPYEKLNLFFIFLSGQHHNTNISKMPNM
jgi:uridine phosphorylase